VTKNRNRREVLAVAKQGSLYLRIALLATCALTACVAITMLASQAFAQTQIRSDFDHDSTGFLLDGAHLIANCGACHSRGIFEGALRECQDCHADGSTVVATAKPARHIQTTEQCDSCHATRSFIPLARMDHMEVVGDCAGCHNNQIAPGKPIDHPPAGEQCDDCHLTVAFQPATIVGGFDHAGIVGNCFACHDGVTATGKSVNHLPTTNVCEDCHRTDTFSLVARFEHSQALGTCSGCHDGVRATGKDADHVPTTAECDSCHTTTDW